MHRHPLDIHVRIGNSLALVLLGVLVAGCTYGSPQWNVDMSPTNKIEVANANFRVGDSIKVVQDSLDRLDVPWLREPRQNSSPMTPLPDHVGTPRLTSALWHEGQNFLNSPQIVTFYFDDDFLLTQIWMNRYTPRRDQSGFIWDDSERSRYPLRLVPP